MIRIYELGQAFRHDGHVGLLRRPLRANDVGPLADSPPDPLAGVTGQQHDLELLHRDPFPASQPRAHWLCCVWPRLPVGGGYGFLINGNPLFPARMPAL